MTDKQRCGCIVVLKVPVKELPNRCIISYCTKHLAVDSLLEACKAQHEAIDRLFTMLITLNVDFYPSKSGQPWEAIEQGNKAIAHAGEEK